MSSDEEREINEKMAIILTIKVDEMEKKIKALTSEKEKHNIVATVREAYLDELSYEEFKEVVLGVLGEIREKVKMSEDDIKTIFYVLDGEKQGKITPEAIEKLRNIYELSQDLREFYRSRINRDMVRVSSHSRRTPSSSWGRSKTTPSRSTRSRTPPSWSLKTLKKQS